MNLPECQGCRDRDALIAQLSQRLAQLEEQLRDLQAKVKPNSSDSSVPPSANPLDAKPPVQKKKSKRRPGGQHGHPPRLRQLLPPERVTDTRAFVPSPCDRCQHPLPEQPGPADPEPTRHQVADLPVLRARVTEYQGHTRTCPCCGHQTHAPIPQELRAHCVGPGLAAALSYLAGSHHVSKRGAGEVAETLFEVPLSLGTVANLEQEMSAALQTPHQEAQQVVREAPVKNVDETSWKLKGKRCWLWVAATASVAVFLIHARRGLGALAALLGEKIKGLLGSDRWSVYHALPPERRQVCWAHLKRDFQKCVDRGGAAVGIGRAGLAAVAKLFGLWHLFRGGTLTREQLRAKLGPVQVDLQHVLQMGRACADRAAGTFCANLLELWPALWQFAQVAGVEPTNNHAERVLRRGVLWRKNSFGCSSVGGCRFVERLLTVVQTLRLQGRQVFHFLRDALVAHRNGQPAPKLVPNG